MGLLETLPRKYTKNLGGVSEVFIGYPRPVIGREKEVNSHDIAWKSYLICFLLAKTSGECLATKGRGIPDPLVGCWI